MLLILSLHWLPLRQLAVAYVMIARNGAERDGRNGTVQVALRQVAVAHVMIARNGAGRE